MALSAWAFHKRVVFTIARERGNLLTDNIKIKKSNRQLLMTPLSVSFIATLKVMNTIKFQINVLLQQKKKMTGTVLFPNDFQVNTLTHFCTNDFNFRAYFSGW